jgi:hypothetical protein
MRVHDIDAVRREANEILTGEDFKAAVEHQKKLIKARKGHFFSKRIKFQWPLRLEEHYQPLNRRCGDKGRTRR